MRSRRDPFVLYRGGTIDYLLMPRGIAGWLQFSLWLALLVPLVLWLDTSLGDRANAAYQKDAIFLFCAGLAFWLIGGLWWMLAHCETIDTLEIVRARQYERRRQKREP